MRKTPKLNKRLLRRLARKLRRIRHEEHFDQGRWAAQTQCGTAACIAGHAIIEAGLKPVVSGSTSTYHMFRCRKGNERSRLIQTVARELLGLTPAQAKRVFDSSPDDSFEGEGWPKEFADRWNAVSYRVSSERRSRIAADLLDAIADTNGDILK